MQTIQASIGRLESQLPLRRRQRALSAGFADAHRAILRSLAEVGRPPPAAEIGHIADAAPGDVVRRLADDDLVVAAGGSITGAYPFSIEPTPHLLTIADRGIHAMCALDAVAVAPVFGLDVVTTSECAVTGSPIRIHQNGDLVGSADPEIRIGVRWQQPDGCAAHSMCREMVFLADASTADRWRGPDPESAGIFDLGEAIEFGVGFFAPLLER